MHPGAQQQAGPAVPVPVPVPAYLDPKKRKAAAENLHTALPRRQALGSIDPNLPAVGASGDARAAIDDKVDAAAPQKDPKYRESRKLQQLRSNRFKGELHAVMGLLTEPICPDDAESKRLSGEKVLLVHADLNKKAGREVDLADNKQLGKYASDVVNSALCR